MFKFVLYLQAFLAIKHDVKHFQNFYTFATTLHPRQCGVQSGAPEIAECSRRRFRGLEEVPLLRNVIALLHGRVVLPV